MLPVPVHIHWHIVFISIIFYYEGELNSLYNLSRVLRSKCFLRYITSVHTTVSLFFNKPTCHP